MKAGTKAAKRRHWLAACLAAGFLSACFQPVPAPMPGQAAPAEFPESHYRQAAAQGGRILRIDPAASLVTVEVHRDGTLARLGHDHVVAGHDFMGYVAVAEGRADLYLPLARLAVDEPELRAAAGLDPQLAMAAIEGTRRNMLEKVLEAERFPFVLIHAERNPADASTLKVSLSLHGSSQNFDIPARIESLPAGIAVSGELSFKQSDFGIVPMSVLGGALQVRDRLDLRFRIVARG